MKIYQPLRPGEKRSFSSTKPYHVCGDLTQLSGTPSGEVELPNHLYWSGTKSTFNVDLIADLRVAYRAVIQEGSEADQMQFLNKDLLVHHWSEIQLTPLWLRRAWEETHPELAT